MRNRVRDFKFVSSENDELNKIQDNVDAALTPILDSVIIDNVILKNVSLTLGTNLVPHKLGRKPQGYVIIGKRGNVNVWDSISGLSDKYLSLEAAANVIVDLLVF